MSGAKRWLIQDARRINGEDYCVCYYLPEQEAIIDEHGKPVITPEIAAALNKGFQHV